MPKVSVVPPEKAKAVLPPAGYSGLDGAVAYCDGDNHPLHLHQHTLKAGDSLRIGPLATDCVAYVWKGAVSAADCALATGSSFIVEHGRSLDVVGEDAETVVLTFAAARAPESQPEGGHVHLLPIEHVPTVASFVGAEDVGGELHADGACPTCGVWLHENHVAGRSFSESEPPAPDIHSHTEDEIIFVIEGEMRLGQRMFGPGTALAVAADTLYGFTVGPAGVRFVNFRAGKPGDIRFADGRSPIDEAGVWRDIVGRPRYIEVA